jgi:hypothetical protein
VRDEEIKMLDGKPRTPTGLLVGTLVTHDGRGSIFVTWAFLKWAGCIMHILLFQRQ